MTTDELNSLVRSAPDGVFLSCRIQPRASKTAIDGPCGNALKIRLTAPPVDGKANAALTAFLAELCNIPKSAVILTSGETSRNKTLFLHGVSPEQLTKILCT